MMKPKIAVCTQMMSSIETALDFAFDHGYPGIDFTIDSTSISPDLVNRLERIVLRNHFEIRFHCAANVEIAQEDTAKAKNALEFLKTTVDQLSRLEAEYFTIHLGVDHNGCLNWERGVGNLKELVSYGCGKGITVCLENLKSGWTAEPESLKKLIELTGAKLTFDLGHANSSPAVKEGRVSGADFLALFKDHVVNAHIYEKEEPHHIAPKDLSLIESQLELLLRSPCDWWVIELSGEEIVARTKDLLQLFLSKHGQSD